MSKGKGKTVFAREATGLVREIGWFTALALVMSAVIGAGINGFAVQAYSRSGAVNSISPLAIILFVAIPFGCSAICLGIMSSAMPRSGGPYVIMSRAVHPSVGFLASWGSWVSIALSVGLLAQYDIYFWGTSFYIAGSIYNDATFLALGALLQDYVPSIILGVILTLIITLIVAFGPNIWGRVTQILFIVPLIGSILTLGVLFAHSAADLPSYWNAVFGTIPGGTYANIMTAAQPYTPDFITSLAALPAIIFAFSAYYASSYVGGEVKNPKRSMIVSLVVGMFFIILLFVAYTGGLANAVGEQFLYAYASSGRYIIGAPAQLPLFAAVYSYTVPLLAIFIAITGALWLLNDLPPFFLIATRSTFAWSFDRQFPEKFADVSERFHSPIWSVLLVFILSIPAVYVSAYTLWGSLTFITFIDCFTYLFICVAGLTFVKRFKSAYEKGSKVGGPATLKFFGALGTALWTFMLAAMMFFIITWDPIEYGLPEAGILEVLAIGLTFAIGLIIYLYYRYRNRKLGIDTSKIYSEIPPE
jgi:amino acid transporter